MSAASCLPLGSIWRWTTSPIALERVHVWGSWGCLMSEGDTSWVSLCVPMRPGKSSFVARLRIRMPRVPSGTRLVLAYTSLCVLGSPTRVLQTTSPPMVRAELKLLDASLWIVGSRLARLAGVWAACALPPFFLGSAFGVCVKTLCACSQRHQSMGTLCMVHMHHVP